MKNILYKSLPADRKPHGFQFKLNTWHKTKGELAICKNGFHASKNIIDAMCYVDCGYVAKVEVKGKSIKQYDKECWDEMRVLQWKKWTKKDSVALAIFAAELVIDNYEKEYPNDTRPREAIEAAKMVLKSDTTKNRSAAWNAASAANVAWSARNATSAAWSAWNAASAANAAWSAACAANAAWSAWNVRNADESAVDDVDILKKCHDFVIKRKGLK